MMQGGSALSLLAALLACFTACKQQGPPPREHDLAPTARGAEAPARRTTAVDLGHRRKDGGGCPRRAQVVRFETDDGVELEGDLHGAGEVGGPAVLLLHMIPPRYDRTSYPPALIARLVDAGITVLNLDRRGAGGSQGQPRAAYLGPSARLDAQGAIAFLVAHRCRVDRQRVAIVGASNGTTTALDYTVHAAGDDRLPLPRALVWLTGGPYSERQNRIARHRALLDPVPMLFVYATAERRWSVALARQKSPRWRFREVRRGGHGTRILSTQPEALSQVVDFLSEVLRRQPTRP